MFVELIEHLRCPAGHEESPLVVAAVRADNRYVMEGVLGCPVCGAEYPIAGGVARFGRPVLPSPVPASMETAMRIAAFLELTDASGFAILCGRWGVHAAALGELVQTPLVLVNAPAGRALGAAAVIEAPGRLPFAAGTARAAALDESAVPPLDAIRSVRQGGRLLGSATLPVPEGVREIARDASDWVGETTAAPDTAPRLVPLRRAR